MHNIKIIQLNVGRSRVSHDLTHAEALKQEADIVLIAEPNRQIAGKYGHIVDREGDVAVKILNKNVGVIKHRCEKGYIKLEFTDWCLICCYISPNIAMEEFRDKMDNIMNAAKEVKIKGVVIAGDVNAKSPMWGSPKSDARGDYIGDWASELNLVFLNTGVPTFERGSSKTHIDITSACQKMAKRVKGWDTVDGEYNTYHHPIIYEVEDKGGKAERLGTDMFFNGEKFAERIKNRLGNLESLNVNTLTEEMKAAVKESTTYATNGRQFPYWWNREIEDTRRRSINARRKSQRLNARLGSETPITIRAKEEYREIRKELRNLINKSKREHWGEMCKELDDDIWGNGYKIVIRGIKKHSLPYNPPVQKKLEWCRKLFPEKETRTLRWTMVQEEDIVPKFTIEELKEAVDTIKNKRAPGLDKIPPEAVKIAVKEAAVEILAVLNRLQQEQNFPRTWKEAKVVLAWKGKDMEQASSYRPICLINVLAKLYEKMVKTRLERAIEDKGGLAPNQYGFRRGRSTIHAIQEVINAAKVSRKRWVTMIAIDVRNAFNSIGWDDIMDKLEDREIDRWIINIIDSYLSYREIRIDGKNTMKVSGGVPQGSVLGPVLWNIVYNELLIQDFMEGVKAIAYADDLAIIVEAEDRQELIVKTNETARRIMKWMKKHELEIAPEKTEAIVLKGPRNRENIKFMIAGREIEISRQIKYLGVTIDDKLRFGPHVREVSRKAEKQTSALTKLMPNIGGPIDIKRKILYGVVQSTLLYGAPIWGNALNIKRNEKIITSVQRRILLRVGSAYRTVSAIAIQAITSCPPIKLLIEERTRIHEAEDGNTEVAKKREREITLNTWREEWSIQDGKSVWTKRLIKDVKQWTTCKHKRTDYFLTQFLSGHGTFGSYTKWINKTENDRCVYCGEVDTPEHTVFNCNRWIIHRWELQTKLDVELEPDNIVGVMLSCEYKWNEVKKYINKILSRKEQEERRRQGRNRN